MTAGPATRSAALRGPAPRVVVLGDLMVDVVLLPSEALRPGTDVGGRVLIRAGGSAANTARWLARLGVRTVLISATGRDPAGRALEASLRADGVHLHVARPTGARTGRIGVLVSADGERAFVADRGAANRLGPGDVRPSWFAAANLLHLPAYSLLGGSLSHAAARAIELARAAGAAVSLDLASAGPLLADGRPAAMALVGSVGPDLLFATALEATALAGVDADAAAAGLLDLAPVVVLKRGPAGATALARTHAGSRLRLDVPVRRVAAADSTGAGDAFDAGFIAAWLGMIRGSLPGPAPGGTQLGTRLGADDQLATNLRRAVQSGHRVARRHLTGRASELSLL